jgi:hypothetical protein
MKAFLERNTSLIAGLFVISLFTILVLGFLLMSTKQSYVDALQRIDKPEVAELPGPKNQVSPRTVEEMNTLFYETPHVVGGWIAKLHYEKLENPVIHFWGRDRIITQTMEAFDAMQKSGKGYSSDELNASSKQSLLNSEEAKNGLIKCGRLEDTNLLKIAPQIATKAKAVCRATIPPFSEGVNLAVVAVIDIDGTLNTSEVQEIRRVLLRLQIDIFNRDYQGRETWARELP